MKKERSKNVRKITQKRVIVVVSCMHMYITARAVAFIIEIRKAMLRMYFRTLRLLELFLQYCLFIF